MSRIRSVMASLLISPVTNRMMRRWHETKRRLLRRPYRVVFYHRVADAWSLLLAQVLRRLLDEYDVELEIRLVSALPVDCVSDPQRLDRYAAYDSMRLARAWGLNFTDGAQVPSQSLTQLAERVILAQPGSLERLVAVTTAAWVSDNEALLKMERDHGAVDEPTATRMLAENFRDLDRNRHYLGGMLRFHGEWFWGLDRLYLLEQRLRDYGLNRTEQTLSSRLFRPIERNMTGSALPLDLEFYFSFRSPYSYLGAVRVVELADRLGLNLVLRPVLPMVTRGIPVPMRKLRYIARDVARTARHDGIPFGPLRDPLGKGVERCLAVFHLANANEIGRKFMLAAMRAIWCEAADLTRDSTLCRLGIAVGLSKTQVDEALVSGNWRAQVETNAAALAVLGLWGVPGMCLRGPDDRPVSVAWGQDRLWVIERAALGVDVAMPPPRLVQ
ncbi:MAG: DsbA family protein [Gammaproteobacteria bacterium]|nr:DsbA family protein [Gammaproteobacteria bacterium]